MLRTDLTYFDLSRSVHVARDDEVGAVAIRSMRWLPLRVSSACGTRDPCRFYDARNVRDPCWLRRPGQLRKTVRSCSPGGELGIRASQQFRWFFADGVIRLVAHMLIVLRAAVRLPGPCFKKVTPS
jgi:hypothetical protein